MSKAFTREDDSVPPVVRQRPPLPEGTPNYVTPRGLSSLRRELSALAAERARLDENTDAPHGHFELSARLAELGDRIASAVVVDPTAQPHDEVHFGATVRLRAEDEVERSYQLVGIDEADVQRGRVAFVAPLARALFGKRVGEVAVVHTPRGDEELEVVAIQYDS